MIGPKARFSQVDMEVRGDPEASLHAGLGELRRDGHRPLPGGTAGEEDGDEETWAGELPPTGNARPQGGPTLEQRDDEPSSARHRSSSHQAYKGRYCANTDCHQFPSPSMGAALAKTSLLWWGVNSTAFGKHLLDQYPEPHGAY